VVAFETSQTIVEIFLVGRNFYLSTLLGLMKLKVCLTAESDTLRKFIHGYGVIVRRAFNTYFGPIISLGTIHSSNCSAVTYPLATAPSLSVNPFLWALLAISLALS